MELKKTIERQAYAVKITAQEDGQVIGRAYVYILYNDLHVEPYGYLEDVFVEATQRGKGIGSKLITEAIAQAREQGCYKLVCTSRNSRQEVHALYKKFGFQEFGLEFRMDLKASAVK